MLSNIKYTQSFQRAFSLIELLTVVAVIGVLATIMIANSSNNRLQKEVESGALITAAKLREAQANALTGRQFTAGTTPCVYRVAWSGSNITSWYIPKSGTTCTGTPVSMGTLTLSGGVSVSGSGSVDFSLPHGQIASAQSITLTKAGVSRAVCIRASGVIEVELTSSSC